MTNERAKFTKATIIGVMEANPTITSDELAAWVDQILEEQANIG